MSIINIKDNELGQIQIHKGVSTWILLVTKVTKQCDIKLKINHFYKGNNQKAVIRQTCGDLIATKNYIEVFLARKLIIFGAYQEFEQA